MKKLDKIEIMGREIKVKNKRMGNLHGEFDGDNDIIYIDAKLKGDVYEDTLLHEVFHAILFYSGINEVLEGNNEEAIVRCMEYNYLPFIKDYFKGRYEERRSNEVSEGIQETEQQGKPQED